MLQPTRRRNDGYMRGGISLTNAARSTIAGSTWSSCSSCRARTATSLRSARRRRSCAVGLPPCLASRRGANGVHTRMRRRDSGEAEVILGRVPPDFSVIVASHNTCVHLERCLTELGAEHEVIVVDTGSVDGSPKRVRERFPHAQLVALRRNPG